MEEIYTLEDFENVLYLRNQLINVPTTQLIEIYQDYDSYLAFLDAVAILSHIDSAFLLFDTGFIDKIERVIQIHRFNCRDDVGTIVNDIIRYLNHIKTYSSSYQNLLKNGYLVYQEDVRKTKFEEQDVFLYSLGYDAVVYASLKEGNMYMVTQDDMFLASLNYFIETIPEFFESEEIQNRAMHKMKKLEKKSWPFPNKIRNYSKETIRSFQKIKTKGE